MADQVQEFLEVPREFLKDGIQFINRAQKRMPSFASITSKAIKPWGKN